MGRRRKTNPLLAVAILRVSTDETTQELGVDAQRAAMADWARKEGVTIAAWHLDEMSGGSTAEQREGLARALANVAALAAGKLVAYRLDRFTRDRVETSVVELELRRLGAELVFADGAGNGDGVEARLMRTILIGVAEAERGFTKRRIRDALAVKRRRGEMTGAPPYGFRAVDGPMRVGRDGVAKPVKLLVADTEEQATIARARELRASGETVRDVVASLASEGRLSRTSKPFTLAAMQKMLTSAATLRTGSAASAPAAPAALDR